MDGEELLTGGNASGAVVRVGDTVRKPWRASTPTVVDYVTAVRGAGADAPAPLGRDEQGRQIIEYVPGVLAMDAGPFSRDQLHRVGGMIRAIHDASERFVPALDAEWEVLIEPAGADLVCHNDLAPWNLIVGDRWLFIDWDGAGPSTRVWDLAYAAQAFTLNEVDADPAVAAGDLAAFVAGYGADAVLRAQLPEAMARRAKAMYERLKDSSISGREPWGSMFEAGHGAHWRRVMDYVARHRQIWIDALRDGTRTT